MEIYNTVTVRIVNYAFYAIQVLQNEMTKEAERSKNGCSRLRDFFY